MSPDQVRSVVDAALRDPTNFPWLVFIVAVVVFALSGGIGAYLAEKFKNTATREDIKAITNEVESVRHTYLERIESLKGLIQLRTAALAERLKAHQDAYALWIKLVQHAHLKEKTGAVADECLAWWAGHCLYLAPEARDAFHGAIFAAYVHWGLLGPGSDRAAAEKHWAKIADAGAAIVRGVELPDIGEAQFAKDLTKSSINETQSA